MKLVTARFEWGNGHSVTVQADYHMDRAPRLVRVLGVDGGSEFEMLFSGLPLDVARQLSLQHAMKLGAWLDWDERGRSEPATL